MSYFTERELREAATRRHFRESATRYIKKSLSMAQASIFLCHSHRDKDLAEGLINYLAKYAINLYVDWKDTEMPDETNRETADKIKERIAEMDYFLVLATRRAMESRWVPWEIGIADQPKYPSCIGIIPVTDPQGIFHGNEYLQLYPSIEFSDKHQLAVFAPGSDRGSRIDEWLG